MVKTDRHHFSSVTTHTLVIPRFRVYRNTGPPHRHELSLAIIYANVLNILRCVQLKQISQVNAS